MCDGITIGGNVSIQISGPCVPPDGSVTAAKINSGNAVDGQVLTADGNGGAAWEAPTGGGPGYLKYVALLTQTGENAPVAVVLENTLGAVAWTRNSSGIYCGNLEGAFPEGKTWCSYSRGAEDFGVVVGFFRVSNDNVYLLQYNGSLGSGDPVDGLLNSSIEIRVYP